MTRDKYLAAGCAAALLLACEAQGPAARYEFSGYDGRGQAGRIAAEFSVLRPGNAGEYRARIDAVVRFRRVDSAAGLALEMTMDSVAFSSSERDSAELAFMREGLLRYRASWRMTSDGKVSDLTENPALPSAEFILRLGPLLAACLPRFSYPSPPADTQSLFDPAEPGAGVIQIRKRADRRSRGQVDGERHFLLNVGGSDSAGADPLAGSGSFRFDPKRGFLRSLKMDAGGMIPVDSGSALRGEFKFRFEAF